jgi:hypothetical protein
VGGGDLQKYVGPPRNDKPVVVTVERDEVDLTAGSELAIDQSCGAKWLLQARICNRGTQGAAPGIAGTFYSGVPDAMGSAAICTVMTTGPLDPGQCASVSCSYDNPPQGRAITLWFRANDNGSGKPGITECAYGNNLFELPKAACGVIP